MTNYENFKNMSIEKMVVSIIDGDFFGGRKQKRCDNCGQALDWSEVEE